MLEDQVANLLQRYFGNYVRGLNKEALKISVWNGDVELKNMQLKPDALNALKLPVKVKAGFLGSLRIKVPWNRLGQEPVLVFLDQIFLLAEPATEVGGGFDDDLQETKRSRIRDAEMKLLERSQELSSEENKSWLGSLIDTIIGNLKLSISNVHIRYEDIESNPGHPFAIGAKLGKLSAFTIDDAGSETFVTGGSLNHIRKLMELDQLSIYLDSDIIPWQLDLNWEELHPHEWNRIFLYGIIDGRPADHTIGAHCYVLQPVSGHAKYMKSQFNETDDGYQPIQKAIVMLDDVTMCLSKNGYKDALKLADNFASFNQRLKYVHYRPTVAVMCSPKSWWVYAYKAVCDQINKASGKLFWEQIVKYARMRKKYISLYVSLLMSDLSRPVVDNNKEIQEMDQDLAMDLIIEWRMLAHKFVNKSIKSDTYLKSQKSKKSWWSFGRNIQSPNDENEPLMFTDEDWKQLNSIIGFKDSSDTTSYTSVEKQDAVKTFVEIHMNHNATKLLGDSYESIAELSCNHLDVFVKLYPETKIFGAKLGSYQLSSPNGLLAKSATAVDSLSGVLCYKPFEANVDWSMVVKASPCYITYLKMSIDEITNFFQSNDAISQTIAMETAAAVQMTIDEVKRTAQRQVNRALKNHARFLLDLDIAAPKLKIPTPFCPDNVNSTSLFLDLGNLMIRSIDDDSNRSKEPDLYVQFDLVLSDVSAFFVDGDYQWDKDPIKIVSPSESSTNGFHLPLIDKCGVVFRFQQIRLENPSYPSVRLSVRLPSLSFHLSPARYHRLTHVLKIFREDNRHSDVFCPWASADFEGRLSILARKGIGNRDAIWNNRYVCLVGPFIYILVHRGSQSYERCISLRGKKVHQLPPELIGGVQHVVAIFNNGSDINKAVENTTAVILRCDTEENLRNWYNRLRGAAYLHSGFAPITATSESSSDSEGSETDIGALEDKISFHRERVFFTGVLDELKIRVTYSSDRYQSLETVLLSKESGLFELRALGGQVEISIRENDMFIGTVLKSLDILDLASCVQSSQTCYLARSVINNVDSQPLFDESNCLNDDEGDDNFYEASESLVESELSFDINNLFEKLPSFTRVGGLLPGDEKSDNDVSVSINSFVKAQVEIYDPDSSSYDNVDMQVVVTLATLSVFFRRPTILAVLNFINAINMNNETSELEKNPSEMEVADDEVIMEGDSLASKEPIIKGFLGKGKSRVIFSLVLKMARAQISLLLENGSRLATLSQDNLFTNMKVFPSTFSINAALGNLKVSDDGLDSNHPYFWICDTRSSGGSSFVELIFTTFNVEDDDYEDFEYSLLGQLSEVRIVFLNRFVQEIVSYFVGLVPSSKHGAVKLKDKKTNSEKWFSATEVEGSPALKMDISLTKPIILIPRRTDSTEYLKLDVVHITIQNTFHWLSGAKDELQAIHLEILTIQVKDINLNVGFGINMSESIIQDVKGLSVVIRRSLRDLLHQIPSIEAAIIMDELKAALSNKEYQIVTECALSNISENPQKIPPLHQEPQAVIPDVIELAESQDPRNVSSDCLNGEVRISLVVSVFVNLVELSLYTGDSRDRALATMQIHGLWLLYKLNNQSEGILAATLKGFTVVDDREGIGNELKLAIGMPHQYGDSFPFCRNDEQDTSDINEGNDTTLVSSMLILDVKMSKYSTLISLCVQKPQLLLVLDFLLAFIEFFGPEVAKMLSNEDCKDPVDLFNAITFNSPIYRQSSVEISFSPITPLVVEHENIDHFIYDGNGGILYLRDRKGLRLSMPSTEPVIFVDHGKKLQFKNVTIKDGQYFDSCVWLGTNSSYLALEGDNVFIEKDEENLELSRQEIDHRVSDAATVSRQNELIFEFQAIGPELAFYNTSKNVVLSPVLSNKLLYAQFDAHARLTMKDNAIDVSAKLLGFLMESNGIRIVDPFDSSLKFSSASGNTKIHVSVADISITCPFSILRLFLAVEDDILKFLQRTSQKITISCSQFDKIGTIKHAVSGQLYSFWRPVAPPGFAVLGDCLTPLDKPPTEGVVVVNKNMAKLKAPLSYKLIWPLDCHNETDSSIGEAFTSGDNDCFIWLPEAPQGYVPMGCVVSCDKKPPPPSSVFCIWSSMVSPCPLRDCVTIKAYGSSVLAFWRVYNSIGSFLPANPEILILLNGAYDLRHIKYGFSDHPERASYNFDTVASSSTYVDSPFSTSTTVVTCQNFDSISSFKLIWSNRDSNQPKRISIWRPVVSSGMVYFGDIAVKGYEPPSDLVGLHDHGDKRHFESPVGYQLVKHLKKQQGAESISFWWPLPPPGFLALGCVACKGAPKQSEFSELRCVRSDMVVRDQFSEESIYDSSNTKFGSDPFSLWTVGNELGTFFVCSSLKKPSRRFALKLVERSESTASDKIIIDAKIGSFSAALYDDYGGLMVPLVNPSASGIICSVRGRTNYLTMTVSFSLAARSFNDKYDVWEPLIEPLDAHLRYQYDLSSRLAPSQMRLASTGNLNLNFSVSNINMILQAYANWNMLSRADYKIRGGESEALGSSNFFVHNHSRFHILPKNKLGKDIYIRVTETSNHRDVIKMPTGDMKPVRIPVLKNMFSAHSVGKAFISGRKLMSVAVIDAQLPNVSGFSSTFVVSIRLTSCASTGPESLITQQSARTSSGISIASSTDYEVVKWNEIFFFKADPKGDCSLELIVTDMRKGREIGFLSKPLNEIVTDSGESSFPDSYKKALGWTQLRPPTSTDDHQDEHEIFNGRIRFSVLFLPNDEELTSDGKNYGVMQISPTIDGPWTTVRLNYAAPAACWRFGSAVVASEVAVTNEMTYLNIRSLVSVRNHTKFVLDLRLVPKSSIGISALVDDSRAVNKHMTEGDIIDIEEYIEIENFDPKLGWIGSNYAKDSSHPVVLSEVSVPTGWCWIDDWHLDSVNTGDGWKYSTDVESRNYPPSSNVTECEHGARERKWIRTRKRVSEVLSQYVRIGTLEPDDKLSLPLYSLQQDEHYILQFRPLDSDYEASFSWSFPVERPPAQENHGCNDLSGLVITALCEMDELLYCERNIANSSGGHKLWFCATVQASELAKDLHANVIQDWNVELKSPLCLSNYLPLAAEYSVYDVQSAGTFVACDRGILHPGESVKIHSADIRNLLFLSMFPQRGWLPVHEAVLISHPNGLPSKTMSVKSSNTGRTVHLILEHNFVKDRPWLPRVIRVYAPYWVSIARCPSLICRMSDLSGKKQGSKFTRRSKPDWNDESVLGVITDEELYDGVTIGSTFDFQQLGLSLSIAGSSGEHHFGPVKNLSPLSNMDESVDLYAYDDDNNCLRFTVGIKPCSYQSIPTKVLSVRPFITFTNRVGEVLLIKLSSDDEPKVLRASDARVYLMQRESVEIYNIQVRLEDTEWSYPLQLTKEDTVFMVLRSKCGSRRLLTIEVRGFEEGSRFIVVFRPGPPEGPYRIENRSYEYAVRVRQVGFGDNCWAILNPCSTINFAWEDTYGQKFIDVMMISDRRSRVYTFGLENSGSFSVGDDDLRFPVHVLKSGKLTVVRIMDNRGSGFCSRPLIEFENSMNNAIQERSSMTVEMIIELGVIGISLLDHRPKELLYLHLERVHFSFSTGYDGGAISRMKIILGYLQLDNQLPLTSMPVLLAPEASRDGQPVFKMTITTRNENSGGVQVYPYIYFRVSEKVWRINIHEPIIWDLLGVYESLQLDRLPEGHDVSAVDPEIRVEVIDISEIRLKFALETASDQRPHGVLGIWSPVLSALGSAFKIQVHLRRVMHRDRFMRKSAILPAIKSRIWRDFIHNPMHLILSVDILGMTSSTLASLSRGFAELSTDGQFLKLRSKQVGSRRITGVREGIIQGTEALAQGFAFGVSGVITKPVESARENGVFGFAHGVGRALLGIVVEPVSGALDFFSLTVDGMGASFTKCLDVMHSNSISLRIRCPRAIGADGVLKEYNEREAVGQMILNLGETTRRFGCTEIFKEPSKFAWSDLYEEHFVVPNQRIVLITNNRVMMLHCRSLENMDTKPSKILWDVPWEEILALELATADRAHVSHLLIHLKTFRRSENFLRVVKCDVEESGERASQAETICAAIRKTWKAYISGQRQISLKVPSKQKFVYFACDDDDIRNENRSPMKSLIRSRGSLASTSSNDRFVKHSIEFRKIWSSELEPNARCRLCKKKNFEDVKLCSIWRPLCPDGYVSVGDVAHICSHGPSVAAVYRYDDKFFAAPAGYNLMWRNCLDDYMSPLSIWHPVAPAGFVSLGCVAVAGFEEPAANSVYCVSESIAEETVFEEERIWAAPESYPWACNIYQVVSDALHFVALREPKETSTWRPMRVVDDPLALP